jgi:hypothetical protein
MHIPMNKAARCQLQTLHFYILKVNTWHSVIYFFNVQFSSIWILIFQLLLLMSLLDDQFFSTTNASISL